LIYRDYDWAARDPDTDWELKFAKTLNVGDYFVIKFAAYIIVNCDSDWDFRMRWQVTQMWVEDDRNTFVI
jgi:hypothetical protein